MTRTTSTVALLWITRLASGCAGEQGEDASATASASATTSGETASASSGGSTASASTTGDDSSTTHEATTAATTTSTTATSTSTSTASTSSTSDETTTTTTTTGEPPPPDVICEPWPAPKDAHDQSVVPLEVEPQDPSATKIVLVAGAPSLNHPPGAHEFFAGAAILAKMLCQTPGVVPVMVRDGWPTDPSIFAGADAIVLYLDGGESHPLADPAKLAVLQAQIDAGAGFVSLHYAVEPPPGVAAQILPWLGGVYEAGYSVNPIWTASYDAAAAHPVTQGLAPMTINDEWYYNMRWVDGEAGVTPILEDVPPEETRTTPDTQAHPGRSEVTAWAFDRADGGRGFGLTGGHWYGNWIDTDDTPYAPLLRRVVVHGILWAAKHPIPPEGAPVVLDPADQGLWIDTK